MKCNSGSSGSSSSSGAFWGGSDDVDQNHTAHASPDVSPRYLQLCSSSTHPAEASADSQFSALLRKIDSRLRQTDAMSAFRLGWGQAGRLPVVVAEPIEHLFPLGSDGTCVRLARPRVPQAEGSAAARGDPRKASELNRLCLDDPHSPPQVREWRRNVQSQLSRAPYVQQQPLLPSLPLPSPPSPVEGLRP